DTVTGDPTRAAGRAPAIAADRTGRTIYAAWQETRSSAVHEAALSMSSDGGVTWSAPIKLNQTPRNPNPADEQAFVPQVQVAADGSVAVTYYDFRFNDPSPGVPTDAWIVRCASDCGNPASWHDEARLSPAYFDIEQAPAARGPF